MGRFMDLFYNPAVYKRAVSEPQTPIKSPYSTGQLTKVAVSELLGINTTSITRTDAMKVPAITRGRGLIVGTLSRYPLALFQYNGATEDGTRLEPAQWMVSTKTNQSPIARMLWTLDDLIFEGMSVWAVERDGDDQITDAIRVLPEFWEIDPDTLGVKINGNPVDADKVVIFEGPQEGLLYIGDDLVKGSRNLSNAWQQRVKSPIPLVELHNTDTNAELEDNEIAELLSTYNTARENGGTAYTPSFIDLKVHGEVKADLFVEGRNAERLDWANMLGLPAAMLDGSMSTATLTYSTTEGKRSEFVDYSLNYWASAIESRLSLDDITPEGTYCRFDLQWLVNTVQPGSNPPSED